MTVRDRRLSSARPRLPYRAPVSGYDDIATCPPPRTYYTNQRPASYRHGGVLFGYDFVGDTLRQASVSPNHLHFPPEGRQSRELRH